MACVSFFRTAISLKMAIRLVFITTASCLSLPSQAAEKLAPPDAVVVKALKAPLPSAENKRALFLWKTFANKPAEDQFSDYTTVNWQDNYALFSAKLVQKAQAQKLDSASLQKVLDLVLVDAKKDKSAYLPVGAYQSTLSGKPIWILIVKWENMGEDFPLGHIRMFAFDQKTLKQVAFMTCG